MRFRLIQRLPLYVSSYFFRYFFVSILIFIFLFFIASFIQIVNEEGVMNGFSFQLLFKSLIFLVPNILSISMPFSFVMSIMLTIGELSSNGELIAIKAGGYSYYDIVKYVMFFSIFLCFFLWFSNNFFAPSGIKKSRENVRMMFTRMTNIYLDSESFTDISDWNIYTDKVYKDGKIKGVFLTKKSQEQENPSIVSITAWEGNYEILKEKGIRINLSKGNLSRFDLNDSSSYWWGNFDKYSAFIPFKIEDEKIRTPNPRELTILEILKVISEGTDEKYIFLCKQEMYMRFFLALSPFAFFILATAVGFIFDRESKSFGFFMSILIIFTYYSFVIFTKFISQKYKLMSIWIFSAPFLLTTLAGIYLWRKELVRR